MASSRGSQTTGASVVLPSRPQSSSTSAPSSNASSLQNTVASRSRALVSPIDASLSLWGEGRRGRVAELEEELRRYDAEQRQHQEQQQQMHQQDQGSSGFAEGARDVNQAERDGTPGSKSSAPGKEAADRNQKQRTERNRISRGDAGPHAPPPPPPTTTTTTTTTSGGIARRDPYRRTMGDSRSRAPLSSTTLLEERLGRWGAGWRPPALRGLPRGGEGFFSEWTHLGQPERFELVKCVNRSVGADGEALSDAELEWAVLCLEEAEERMAALDFSTAAGVLERVLGRCPGLTLAYYRLALSLLAARGAQASMQARLLLDCSMYLEGAENRHLSASVDLVLRILRNDAIPEAYWSEDYPRSLGDLRALEAAVDHLM